MTSKMLTKTSGWQRDRGEADGYGHKPYYLLNPKNLTSEYRDRFNPEQQYHRVVDKDTLPQLKKAEFKYKYNR